MRVAKSIELTDDERDRLKRIAHAERSEVRLARRAGIVLLCADGLDNMTVGEMMGVDRIQVGRWRNRYATGGFEAIARDRPRGGRKPVVDCAEVVRLTTQSTPEAATQWNTRSLAAVAGCSDSTVQRIWKKHELKPHRVRPFKVSRDPRFVEKLEDSLTPRVWLAQSLPWHFTRYGASRLEKTAGTRHCLSPSAQAPCSPPYRHMDRKF